MTAHQRLIRDRMAARTPRAVVPLSGCQVVRVPASWARRIILNYEWLGTMPAAPLAYYGLVGPHQEELGVVSFGHGSGTLAKTLCGPDWVDRSIVLERGACVHFAHEHAASFLISRACKLVAEDFGMRVITAYSDPEAGEIGTVYQACNWLYLGAGNGRRPKDRFRWEGRVSRRGDVALVPRPARLG